MLAREILYIPHVHAHVGTYVGISVRTCIRIDENVPLKNEHDMPVPHGRNTARKVGGVTGSIGGLLSINNVIIGC